VVAHPQITGGYLVIHGERRWAAALREGGPLLAYRLADWWDFVAWMIMDSQHRYEPGALAMTLSDALLMTERAKWYTGPSARNNADATIGEYLGIDRHPIQALRQVMALRGQHGDDIDAVIVKEVREVDRGVLSPGGAYGRIKKAIDRKNAPVVTVQQQRRILINSAQIGAGIIDGLTGLGPDLDPTLTARECAEHAKQLGAVRTKLEQVIRQLKERAR
jgi:hypothetical protein